VWSTSHIFGIAISEKSYFYCFSEQSGVVTQIQDLMGFVRHDLDRLRALLLLCYGFAVLFSQHGNRCCVAVNE
jgi:hypothetical protein